MDDLEAWVNGLTARDASEGDRCLKRVQAESRRSNAAYPYFERFAELMESDRSYLRTRGLVLIAENARWDEDNRVDEILSRYLKHIADPKPITARQCVKCLPEIARDKPELAGEIRDALLSANPARYSSAMRPLVEKDIRDALKALDGE